MDIAYIAGEPAVSDRPFGRFLPPLEAGVVRALVARESLTDSVVVDPFGNAPELALEAAEAGCAVVVAANNPVTRFVLERQLDPLSEDELQAALARLAAAEKDGRRLEPFLLGLYETECGNCAEVIPADYFVWDDDSRQPILKGYTCLHCGHFGEDSADEADRHRAAALEGRGLTQAQALEDLAPSGDPYRRQAEAALAVFPGRALYGIVTLLNKIDQLEPVGREAIALHALLLSCFDAADNMWAHPEGRERPKQLSASPQFRENNLWRALERGVTTWTGSPTSAGIAWWPESGQPQPGTVSIFSGSVRKLAATLDQLSPWQIVTIPPRPNQAYWTLSALWAAWLWGRQVAEPIRAALRRRRYDWNWHAAALRQTAEHLTSAARNETQLWLLVPEAEPKFTAACMAGFDAAGWGLSGRCLRLDDRQAQLLWRKHGVAESSPPTDDAIADAADEGLHSHGEPGGFALVHAHVAAGIAGRRGYAAWWRAIDEPPVSALQNRVETALSDPRRFVRLDQRQDPETGIYWLTAAGAAAVPAADRVEQAAVGLLRQQPRVAALAFDRELSQLFPGLATPDRGLVRACLESYANEAGDGSWQLRPEDTTAARARDLREIRESLQVIGERLGYKVRSGDAIVWHEGAAPVVVFTLSDLAVVSLASTESAEAPVSVIPGGRAGLLAYKSARDPRLRTWLTSGLTIVKFRHIRRLLEDTTLTKDNLLDRLQLDPPEHQEPQLPLL